MDAITKILANILSWSKMITAIDDLYKLSKISILSIPNNIFIITSMIDIYLFRRLV